jgi:iron(II)-dependent oxidoreductase
VAAIAARKARLVEMQAAYLDRYAVTNEQFQEFVRAGGYLDIEIWDEEVWPAVADFADVTGCPGPRYWRHGRFLPGHEDHPVVGVCWYEAAAYARWVGKRLPTDAEWVKAACAPVALKTGTWLQRKYPWGDAFSNERANLFAAKSEGTVPVDQYPKGSTSGGHCQLIGNVWEWTASNFGCSDDPTLTVATPMKSIRGGAFDTYFESQATCHFQSGESPLGRKHNIGFRLALSARELAPTAAPRPVAEERTESPRVPAGAQA